MAEGDEPIDLALPSSPVDDDGSLLELAIGRKEGADGIGGGFRPKATDEELSLAAVTVGDGPDVGDDAGLAAEDSIGDDVAEPVERKGLDDLAATAPKRKIYHRSRAMEGKLNWIMVI